nr:transmembrane and coiled-coil domain-containing protein 4 [Quercus suber]
MGTSNNGRKALTDILITQKLRTDLVSTVALISDAMRRQLLGTFEARSAPVPTHEKYMPPYHEADQTASEAEILEDIKRGKEETASPRMQGLRKAALTYFDKWQNDVLHRLGEVLHIKSDAVRGARANAKANADFVRKNPQQEIGDWFNCGSIEGGSKQPKRWFDDLPERYHVEIADLSKQDRIIVLASLLLLLLSLGHYTSRSRTLMIHLSQVLLLANGTLANEESNIAQSLLSSAGAEMSADQSVQRHIAGEQASYRWKVGMATFPGAALIGVSGGLFGAYGGRLTGAIIEQYAHEVQDFEFLLVSISMEQGNAVELLQDTTPRNARKIRVVIGISGSIASESDFIEPWTIIFASRIECFGLSRENDALLRLSGSVSSIAYACALDFARYKLLTLVATGLWPFGLLRAENVLDNPFAVAKARSDKLGECLLILSRIDYRVKDQ